MDWKAESKVGSMDYVHHQPGGGDKEVTMKSYLNYNCDLKI